MTALNYVRNLHLPTPLSDAGVTYKILLEDLRKHYGKKSVALASRYDFSPVRQKENQSVEEFAAALREAAVPCVYDAGLDTSLRDQFVIGLKVDRIRRRLLEKSSISFPDAVAKAAELERYARDSIQIGGGKETSMSQVKRHEERGDYRTNEGDGSGPRSTAFPLTPRAQFGSSSQQKPETAPNSSTSGTGSC